MLEKNTDNTARPGNEKKQKLEPGTHLGRYLVIEQLGTGGMGEVYKAYDPRLNRGIALKIMTVKNDDLATLAKAKHSLLREAQALAQLSHPNVVAVHDFGEHEEDVYIAMELVEGKTLREWLEKNQVVTKTATKGRKTVEEVMSVMIAAGEGLAAAHKVGLVHRDFKPRNVIIGNDGRVRVLDFGLVLAMEHEPNSEGIDDDEDSCSSESNLIITPLTRTDLLQGTPHYMSPEQHMKLKTDHKTDQFSYCVVLFEALYGQRPFKSDTLKGLRKKILRREVVKPSQDTNVPIWLNNLVMKGLEPNPKNRFTSIDRLLEKLRNDPEKFAKQKRATRNRALMFVTLVLLAIILPVSVWYGLQYRKVLLCKDTSEEFVGVWDKPTREAVKSAFMATNKPYAWWTWERVEKNFDDYLSNWARMRSEACEARHVHGTQSGELFDLRMGCLKTRKQELNALINVLTKADTGIVERAAQASASLTGIDICDNEKALREPYPPPANKKTKERVAYVRKQLIDVDALGKTGLYQAGLHLVEKVAKDAETINYIPIKAETQYFLGNLLSRAGEYKKAEPVLMKALTLAGGSRDILLAAKIKTELAWVVGYGLARIDEGLLLGRDTEVLLSLGGGDDTIRSWLLNVLGLSYWKNSQYQKALEYFEQTLEIWKKIHGPDHPYIAAAYNNMGVINQEQGEYDKALALHEKALGVRKKALGTEHTALGYSYNNMGWVLSKQEKYEKALDYYTQAKAIWEKSLGPKHPKVGTVCNNMALVYQAQGEYDKALENYKKSLSIDEKVFGLEHPGLAWPLSGIGTVLVDKGEPKKALTHLERVLVICEHKKCDPEPYGRGLFGYAQALVATRKGKQRAKKLALLAREVFGKTPKGYKKELVKVDAWLKKNR